LFTEKKSAKWMSRITRSCPWVREIKNLTYKLSFFINYELTGILAASELLSNKSDRGRGMSAQQIAWIEAYRQFDRPTYEQQGFGLGLAIAQQLAQIYGGQLIVDSILSQGTNVTISLPLVQQGINNTSVIQL
jgi:signal transduction histidine kinase